MILICSFKNLVSVKELQTLQNIINFILLSVMPTKIQGGTLPRSYNTNTRRLVYLVYPETALTRGCANRNPIPKTYGWNSSLNFRNRKKTNHCRLISVIHIKFSVLIFSASDLSIVFATKHKALWLSEPNGITRCGLHLRMVLQVMTLCYRLTE